MFVIKHFRRDGSVAVSACDSYEYDAESPRRIDTFTRNLGIASVEFGAEDSVFIENIGGKTVTAIRPVRS